MLNTVNHDSRLRGIGIKVHKYLPSKYFMEKKQSQPDYYIIIPSIIGIVGVGTLTNYNTLYTMIGAIVGWAIGKGIKAVLKKK